MKCLKIVASSFHPRSVRMKTGLNGNPVGYFSHSQNFCSEEEIIDLLKFNLDRENTLDPGIHQDILIVSSNSKKFDRGTSFLNDLDGSSYNHGTIFARSRENIGYSFGAFNYGYQLFKNKYDFYIFTEDDISIYQANTVVDALNFWKEGSNCGFVPFIGQTKISKSHRKALSIEHNDFVSCHGGIGMSSARVLDEVDKKNGCLPHYSEPDQSYEKQILKGEIEFTFKIKELGYSFAEVPKKYIFTAPSYDLMRGLQIKKFPSFAQKILYYALQKGAIPIIFKLLVWLKIKKIN